MQRTPPRSSESESQFDRELEALCDTIDHSRKRNLSPGLLRRDLAVDRLKSQEESASPLLKKKKECAPNTPIKANMAMTMAEFKAYMDANTNKRLDSVDGNMKDLSSKFDRIEKTVDQNSRKLSAHDEAIAAIRDDLSKLKDGRPKAPSPLHDRTQCSPGTTPHQLSPDDLRDYLRARRSLRLWPIIGSTRDLLWKAVGEFLFNNLKLDGRIQNPMIEEVTKVVLPSGPRVRDEVLVTFSTDEVRDMVLGQVSNLSPYVDDDRRATAGVRMEVPKRLTQEFRVLFKYGQNLRARHGDGTRRHVKFDDENKSLFLNVKLPGDDSWSKVSPAVARRGLRARQALTDGELERRLDITGPLQPISRPRASSSADQPMLAPPTLAAPWNARRSESISMS